MDARHNRGRLFGNDWPRHIGWDSEKHRNLLLRRTRPRHSNILVRPLLDSQVAGNHRPLYPKADHYRFEVAHNYEPLALQACCKEMRWLRSNASRDSLGSVGPSLGWYCRLVLAGAAASKSGNTRYLLKPRTSIPKLETPHAGITNDAPYPVLFPIKYTDQQPRAFRVRSSPLGSGGFAQVAMATGLSSSQNRT